MYGCGKQAEKFIRAYPDTTIAYCLDDTLHGRKFYDWPIYKPLDRVEDLRTKYTVVFTDNTSVYGRISREFQRAGLREFEHFIPHSLFRKKMALTWGNCHVEYVKNFLLYSGEFASCYGFYPKKKLWDMREEDFDMEIFRHCDLLILSAYTGKKFPQRDIFFGKCGERVERRLPDHKISKPVWPAPISVPPD